jgi:Xaa-Pro aminopeptidase
MPVSEAELRRRCDKIQRLMLAQHVNALLIPSAVSQNDSSSVRYITNHRLKSRREYVVFPAQGNPIYIAPRENEKVAAIRHTWIKDIRVADFGESMPSMAADILRELKADHGEIGIVGMKWVMPYGDFPVLSRKLPKARFRDASDLMNEVRMVKSPEEIRFVQDATELADKGYERVLELIRKGTAELDIVGEVFKIWIAGGVERTILLTATGPNTNGTIDYPSTHIFEKDDIYIFSVELAGPSGYWTQIVRPIYLGKVLNEYHECFNVCREAMNVGLSFLKPGNRICDVVRPMHERIKRGGHSVGHWIGHNMGMDVGEPPHLNPDVETTIQEGMVITLHPFAKKDNRGIFTGDTFVVEKDGPRNLSGTKLEFRSC